VVMARDVGTPAVVEKDGKGAAPINVSGALRVTLPKGTPDGGSQARLHARRGAAGIRDIHAQKGSSGELLDQVVQTFTTNSQQWQTMMDEEHYLQPVKRIHIIRTAVVITIATLIGHLIPLVPFMVLDGTAALISPFVLSGIVLSAVDANSAFTLVDNWLRKRAAPDAHRRWRRAAGLRGEP
jgi:hypothetical protein